MKKQKLYKGLLITGLAVIMKTGASIAQIPPPPTPISPTLDFLTNTMESVEGFTAQAMAVQQEAQRIQSETLSEIKSFSEKVKLALEETLFGKKKDEPNLASVRTIEECKIADITDEDSIAEAFHTLFLTYPADILEKYPQNQRAVKQAYRDKAVEFGNDAMIEMYITVRDLEERMTALKAEYDELSKCYVQGETSNASSCSGASATEEEVGVWSNYYKVNVIYDSMLKITEELMALKAQYEVAQAVLAGIEPVEEAQQNASGEEGAKEEQVSHNEIFHYVHTDSKAFAQMFSAASTASVPEAETTSVLTSETAAKAETLGGMSLTSKNAVAEQANPNQDIVQAKAYNISSPFAGTADQFQASVLANNAYHVAQTALKAHNLKQQLPEYQKIFLEYNKMKELHQKAISQLIKSEECNVRYADNYYNNPQDMWYGKKCKRYGTSIVCETGMTITAAALKGISSDYTLCPDKLFELCRIYGITEYSKREGFSGWLISAYKTAKAEKTLGLNQDNFSTTMSEEGIDTNVSNLENIADQYMAENKAGTSDSSLLKPSDEPMLETSLREQNLIKWQLGAEAAKKLGEDMVALSPKWGRVKETYQLWNDEKLVYEQYLNGKYENMRIYVQNMDLRPLIADLAQEINKLLPDSGAYNELITWSDIKRYNTNILKNLINSLSDEASTPKSFSNLEQLQRQIDKSTADLRNSFNAQKASLDSKKSSIYENLDNENQELNEFKTTYNTAMQKKADAEGNIEGQQRVIEISQARKAKSADVISNFESTAESSIGESNKEIVRAGQEAESVLSEIEDKRESIDSLRLNLEDTEDKIALLKRDFSAQASDLENLGILRLGDALNNLKTSAAPENLLSSSYISRILSSNSGINLIYRSVLSSIINISDNVASDVRQQIINRINEASKQLDEKNIFDRKEYDDIVNIHKEMLNNIQNPDINVSATASILGSLLTDSVIEKLASKIIVAGIFDEICEDNTCYESDNEYFVGLPPKPRDFRAPKMIASIITPPLREVVHFDATDFENIIKSDAWMTTKYDFLNQGQDMPAIWQQILGDKGFVEKDIDIREILSHDDAVLDEIKKEDYPCTTGKYDIKIRNGDYYVTGSSGKIEKLCSDVRSLQIRRKILETGKIYSYADIRFTDGSYTTGSLSLPPEKILTSELATILTYDNGITFNDYIKEIMEFYEELKTVDDFTEEDQELEKIYQKELLTRNQFGNFLEFVEQEMLFQDNLDQLEVKLDSNREKLKELLAEIDYVPEEKFDLADDKTYSEIAGALDTAKNEYVAKAVSLMNTVQPLNEVLEEKITKMNNIIGAMQMDSDELVLLDDNTAADSALSEKIKGKRTDESVRGKYDEEAQKAHEDNLNSFEEPYCANYN